MYCRHLKGFSSLKLHERVTLFVEKDYAKWKLYWPWGRASLCTPCIGPFSLLLGKTCIALNRTIPSTLVSNSKTLTMYCSRVFMVEYHFQQNFSSSLSWKGCWNLFKTINLTVNYLQKFFTSFRFRDIQVFEIIMQISQVMTSYTQPDFVQIWWKRYLSQFVSEIFDTLQ